MSWREFWDGDHSIYVNARHRDLHYAGIAADMAALVPAPSALVLDYGCGEALRADLVAAACGRLYLFDTAPSVQAKLRQRFVGEPKIDVLDEAAAHALTEACLDMIVCNSVLQYLSAEGFTDLLGFWHAKLKPGAILVVADVIPNGNGAVTDVTALLRFAAKGGFLGAALRGLAATFFSNYRKLRAEIGLSTYSEAELMENLGRHGFAPTRVAHNIGHNQARMTFVARRI